jgi:hypothetical protein
MFIVGWFVGSGAFLVLFALGETFTVVGLLAACTDSPQLCVLCVSARSALVEDAIMHT